ncbi:hypothetical protein Tco_0540061 [Tanacetum coccineum]
MLAMNRLLNGAWQVLEGAFGGHGLIPTHAVKKRFSSISVGTETLFGLLKLVVKAVAVKAMAVAVSLNVGRVGIMGFEEEPLLYSKIAVVVALSNFLVVSLRYLFEMVTGHGEIERLGRIEFSLLTGFSIGKVIFPKVKAGDIPPLVRRLFPEKVLGKYKRPKGVSYNVKGLELLDFVKDDEKCKNISDVDAVRVCLLL